jgi:hypothetical protein
MEGGEHSSRELTVSVKVPCQECGGLGYIQTVEEGHVVGDPTTACIHCDGEGFIPDDMPLSQFQEMLKRPLARRLPKRFASRFARPS